MARFSIKMPDGTPHFFAEEQVTVNIGADGYARWKAFGSELVYESWELMLSFEQVNAAMQEERDLWK